MIGVTNAKYNADYQFNNANTIDLTFQAGGTINKGDLVEVICEDLDKDWPTLYADGSANNLGSMSKPQPLEGNPEYYHVFHMNTNGVQHQTGLYSTIWKGSRRPLQYVNSIQINNTQLHTYTSSGWAEPMYIGEGFWLIFGAATNTATVTQNGVSYSYPAQAMLIYVDQKTGIATKCNEIFTTCGNWQMNQYGKPIIFRLSDTEFVVAYTTYLNSIYQICVRTLEFTKNTEEGAVGLGTIAWKDEALSIFASAVVFSFFASCCNFVNKETREIYFLTNNQYNYTHLIVHEDGSIVAKPTRTMVPDLTKMERVGSWVTQADTGNFYTCVMDHYNNFGVYNHITSSDNKHFFAIYNYYYYHFMIDYNTHDIKCEIVPLMENSSMYKILAGHWKNSPTDLNRERCRDWCLMTNYYRSQWCHDNLQSSQARIPFLWKLSNDRYLVAYADVMTYSYASDTVGRNFGNSIFYILEYNDILHELERHTEYSYTGYIYNIDYPGGSWCKPYVFVDTGGYIQMIMPYYQGSYQPNGQCISHDIPLKRSQIHNLAYKFGTIKPDFKKHRYKLGIAKHSALNGEMVTIHSLDDDGLGYVEVLENEEGGES